MKLLKDIFVCAFLASLTVLAVYSTLLVRSAYQNNADLPNQIDAHFTAVEDRVLAQVSRVLDGDPNSADPLDALPLRRLALLEIDKQADALQLRLGSIQSSALTAYAAGLSEIDRARRDMTLQLTALNYSVHSVAQHANGLMDTYAELPDQLGARLEPSWQSLEPEITCRQTDGTGYGGCWHSRVTALMGEAARVGGVFTQQFPLFTTSVNTFTVSFADMAKETDRRFFHPPPMTTGEKFKAAGKTVLGLGTAALRGGVF